MNLVELRIELTLVETRLTICLQMSILVKKIIKSFGPFSALCQYPFLSLEWQVNILFVVLSLPVYL